MPVTQPAARPSFVLVHGGAHGAWCWDRLVPELEALPGVACIRAVDLPGHGTRAHEKPLVEITRADYIAAVAAAIEEDDLRDVVLVGHSMAGISVPWAATRMPERIRHLVLISTTTPPAGESVLDVMTHHPLSPIRDGIDFAKMFCNDLLPADREWLLSQLCDEPPGPQSEKVEAWEKPADLPVTYVLLERDQALAPALQREVAERLRVDRIVPFDAGHSAFVSRPRELARLLADLAGLPIDRGASHAQ